MRNVQPRPDHIPGRFYKCGICKKTFYVEHQEMWVYRLRSRSSIVKFCSYTCFRTAEKSNYKPKQMQVHPQKADYRPPERWFKIREMRDAGVSHREIAAAFGMRETSIGSIISKLNRWERGLNMYDR